MIVKIVNIEKLKRSNLFICYECRSTLFDIQDAIEHTKKVHNGIPSFFEDNHTNYLCFSSQMYRFKIEQLRKLIPI